MYILEIALPFLFREIHYIQHWVSIEIMQIRGSQNRCDAKSDFKSKCHHGQLLGETDASVHGLMFDGRILCI